KSKALWKLHAGRGQPFLDRAVARYTDRSRSAELRTMLDLVIEARKASLAPGMDVQRILPFRKRRMVGPFIFMDHAGPVAIRPEPMKKMDVLPHPHIGLSTVSYLFGGQVTHRDSLGVQQVIRPGEVNWM